MKVLGISCFYHDSAVAAIEDGNIRFAIQEERLSRVKHDNRFPIRGLSKALEYCDWDINDVDNIVFYENPDLKLRRIFDQVITDWPKSWKIFSQSLPRFYKYKYPVEKILMDDIRYTKGKISFCQHHKSHAAAAFYTSSFEKALVITIDGVGEYETTAVFLGDGNSLKKVASIHFPDSLGLLYSVFTQYLGFRINNGEYKVMGLAPYGEPKYIDRILNKIIVLHKDGAFHLKQRFFSFNREDRHYSKHFVKTIGIQPRTQDDPVLQEHKDIAASIQKVLELALINMLKALLKKYPNQNVCFGGGVALNCTANAQMIRDLGINLHIHPAAGDAGGAIGAAMDAAISSNNNVPHRFRFSPYLGVKHLDKLIEITFNVNKIAYRRYPDIAAEIAKRLANGQIAAVVHGRDEWGPRALGNRSILADPRTAGMKDHLNAKIKFREQFRPFAPVVMEEHYSEFFETLQMQNSPYMLFTHKVLNPEKIAATVHVNNTSRVQSVSEKQNPYLYKIISEFYKLTNVPVLINTSFNLRGEPIVSSPSDALNTFYSSGIDFLAIEDFMVSKDQTTA